MTELMTEIIPLLVVFVCACVIHEYSHYYMAKFQGFKPKIKIKWYGMVTDFYMSGMKYSEKINNHLIGVVVGAIPILLYNNDLLTIAYFVACLNDLISASGLMLLKYKFGDRYLIDTYSLVV